MSKRKSYVARLIKEQLTDQAYSIWVNRLTRDQRKRLGLLYDGSFEFEPGNWGFDWHIHPQRDVFIDRLYIFGGDMKQVAAYRV